ncbi:MAG: ABC transporter substrate-binding protein [Bacteroidales bacterium]|nr:ABC transporter substrate-binding protein [Bacteroidales bacterium]MCF8375156.1 ABC transporter substrate-binding protein [Bacteroidales bacterium]MCF8401857.1 ABC transporter substrate-binding protein [Bacteroidales bacterium]
MKKIIKDLWLAIALILGASAILLLSDLEQRKSSGQPERRTYPRIAVMQISSTPLLDSHVKGVTDRLQKKGFVSPDKSNLSLFNPQGDPGTASTIAKEIVYGPYDLVITSSTTALQTLSKANQNGSITHVFGAVTDPYGAGVGITGPEPGQHPPYMAGIGTFQPVEKAIRILKEMNPGITRIGVVWNPSEQCSEACVLKAKMICEELDIELVEAIATNTSEVAEATKSLFSKGIQAIWIGGDTVANASISMIIDLAGQLGIPVITNDPLDAEKGALFGLGADYYTVGEYTADLAAEILNGRDPSEISIENVIPEQLKLNRELLARLGGKWKITANIQEMIHKEEPEKDEIQTIDFASSEYQNQSPDLKQLIGANRFLNLHAVKDEPMRIALINLVQNLALENSITGFKEGLKESGLMAGTDFIIKEYCAQGEIGQLPQIIDAALQEQPDMVVTITTPAFIAAANRVNDIPLVFSVASDPDKLNIFKGGVPDNICGIHDDPPVDEVLDMAMKHDPKLTKVGIVYDAAQMNSMISVDKLRKVGQERNVEVLEATASTTSELSMATQSVIQRGADAIILSADNLAYTGFPAILKVANGANIPIYSTEMELVKQGAVGAIGDDFFNWGFESGQMAAKVLAGVPPSQLEIRPTSKLIRSEPENEKEAFRPEHKLKLRIVMYSETEFAERCHEGLVDGIMEAGLKEGRDYELITYNAQGDMSTLSSIMTTIKAGHVDLLMVISTPTLQAALRQAGSHTRIVFTGVGDGVKAGAGKSETDHLPNVTGISTRSPFGGMARLISQTMPKVKKVGTLFSPAEINSVLYKDWFKEALAEYNIELLAVPVSSSAEVSQAASELCRHDIQLLGQIVDNLTRPGFALIARKAAENNLPVFVFDSDQMKDGGALCLARDYYDAGLEAAEKAIRVLKGENPADIPFNNTKSEKLIYNPVLVQKYKLNLPESLKKKADVFINE